MIHSIWSNLEVCFDPLNDAAYAAWKKVALEQGYAPGWVSWMAGIFIFGAEPFSISSYMQMFPYGSEQVAERRFNAAVEQGILQVMPGMGYRATPKRLDAVQGLIRAASEPLTLMQPIPSVDLVKIN